MTEPLYTEEATEPQKTSKASKPAVESSPLERLKDLKDPVLPFHCRDLTPLNASRTASAGLKDLQSPIPPRHPVDHGLLGGRPAHAGGDVGLLAAQVIRPFTDLLILQVLHDCKGIEEYEE